MPRTLAIGDIHGCSTALAALLKAVDPQPSDTINRGIDSKGVIDQLLMTCPHQRYRYLS
jgi:serine/threonine protein phosphatase 1